MLTLGSFFDGLGGWPLAAERAGIKPVWASEIEEYCQAVTAYHFPSMKQLGDITKLKAEDLEPVDIICAGSPCQGLSLSGKMKGLDDERSGLFVDSIKLVHGLRKLTGKPRYFVWENVPGAFITNKGNDFRAVLEEITKTEIPMPKDRRWAESGCVEWGVQVRLRGGHSILNTGVQPNAVSESFLWQILEDSPQEKYYLSARAAQGILRRAKERGKKLPPMLEQALIAQSVM